MLSPLRQQQVRDRVDLLLTALSSTWQCTLSPIESRFDLSGRAAGMYVVRGANRWLRFNPWLFDAEFTHNLEHTVAHEVAHYAADFRFDRRNIKPHGQEWRAIMTLLGVPANVTHQQDTSVAPTRTMRSVEYQCQCRTHALSMVRHNRVMHKGARYLCRHCGYALKQKLAITEQVT